MGIELTHLRQKFHTRDSRHLQVGNDNVRLLRFENAKCLFAVGRFFAPMANLSEHQGQDISSRGFVVDDEHPHVGKLGKRAGASFAI